MQRSTMRRPIPWAMFPLTTSSPMIELRQLLAMTWKREVEVMMRPIHQITAESMWNTPKTNLKVCDEDIQLYHEQRVDSHKCRISQRGHGVGDLKERSRKQ